MKAVEDENRRLKTMFAELSTLNLLCSGCDKSFDSQTSRCLVD